MRNVKRFATAGTVAIVIAALAGVGLRAADIKVADPTTVVMIVNRDSNEIAFMDIKSRKIVGKTFLGNNVNPHMVMMSPDGRYVVTGGTRANKAYVIDSRTLELVKVIPTDQGPEHLSFSPDSRWYCQGNPDGDSISVRAGGQRARRMPAPMWGICTLRALRASRVPGYGARTCCG